MTILYEDGQEQIVDIGRQARIWSNILSEAEVVKSDRSRSSHPTNLPPQHIQEFLAPLIHDIICKTYEKTQAYVPRDMIQEALLIQPKARVFLEQAYQSEPRTHDFNWYIGNQVDWLSAHLTQNLSEYNYRLGRQKRDGKWAYRPIFMKFDYPEDEAYFAALLCLPGESIADYANLFDAGKPKDKRAEFDQQRNNWLTLLTSKYGMRCLLQCPGRCNPESGFEIDHLIPLSSNKLNKELRGLKGGNGRKAPTQSFGSNHPDNLVLACKVCNNHKMHRFLERQHLQAVLQRKRQAR